ncbi:ribonuclease N [Ottowia sp. GY511]|uniref:Ribonuclease domain-containing protein n=1 Tax=Ottowia flava TaxID=2675430 RepID=A0ABW4KY74_9BURK|nr:ribonuclease domain-containing protein [Ottowia sp. GY511]TXK22030.1 ribonuclease N [Ottowia sp. GY511]
MLRTAALRVAQSLLTVSLAVAAVFQADTADARGWLPERSQTTIAAADLPRQGQRTYSLILQGGPFPHDKDGSVFGNRERLLPRERRGYYREYTVETPGARHRGARRIVCGGVRVTLPDACYYTSDHYSSFRMIVP